MTEFVTVTNVLATVFGVAWAYMGWRGDYGSHWFYDNAAHLFAGLTLGGYAAAYPYPIGRAVVVALGAAVLWEAFEYHRGIYPWVPHVSLRWAWEDTQLDTWWVLAGATAMGLLERALTVVPDLLASLPK